MAGGDLDSARRYTWAMDPTDQTCAMAQRLLTAFDLFEAGVQMRRQQLMRQYPDAPEDEIRQKVLDWLYRVGDEPNIPCHVRSARFEQRSNV